MRRPGHELTHIVTGVESPAPRKRLICRELASGTGLASKKLRISAVVWVPDMQSEVLALLFPEPSQATENSTPLVTALLRDDQGLVELRRLRPDKSLLRMARVAGRFNCGKPILDPGTREVIGYEIEPIAIPA